MDLVLMGLLVLAGAGGGYAVGRGGRRQGNRLATAVAALQERNSQVDEALGRHAVNTQQLKDGLEALKGDLDRRLHLFDVYLNTAARKLDEMGAAVHVQWAQELQKLRTLLEEEGERVKELAVEQRVQGSDVQGLKERSVDRHRELDQLAAVVQRLEHATGNATGNAGRIEALELAQGVADGRLAQQELRLAEVIEHTSNLAKDTLASLRELKEELVADADAMNTRQEQLEQKQEEVFKMLENRLGEVQGFIVKAADEARARREATQAPAPMEQPASELSQLLAQQQAMANTFRARRQAQGGVPAVASVFPFLSGGREAGL